MMLDQVKNLSHQMRLFGIHQAAERRAAEALAQQLHPLDFLRLVLEEELLARKDRTAKALVTKARFRFRGRSGGLGFNLPQGSAPSQSQRARGTDLSP